MLRKCSTKTPNTSAERICPTVLEVLFRPRLRALRILMKSSMKPTPPSMVASASTSRPDADGPSDPNAMPTRCDPK
ncbi:Uncharacterised protein [Mycobacteroides abscessus subsp. abscessus]|nr:Uncharacterised protein [Mycobacteroides abscessus subsp. abscessus]